MKYNIITIEREYASGGSQVGRLLAEKLGIPYYGREILDMISKKVGTTPEQIEHLEETATNSVLYSLAMMNKIALGMADGLSLEGQLYLAEAEIIKKVADEGSCIIVGRCANWVLRERKDILNVFIHSDRAIRENRAIEEYGYDSNRINTILRKQDKRRSGFYSANSRSAWDDKTGYHLILDSGKLGIEKCVDIINAAAR